MRIAVFILLLLTNLSLSAQTFTGKVKGKKGEFLVGASVVASTESKSTVAYCLTSDKGEYKLTIPKGKKRRTRQTLWRAVQMLTQKLSCQTIHDCPKVVPLHYESEWQ